MYCSYSSGLIYEGDTFWCRLEGPGSKKGAHIVFIPVNISLVQIVPFFLFHKHNINFKTWRSQDKFLVILLSLFYIQMLTERSPIEIQQSFLFLHLISTLHKPFHCSFFTNIK